MGCKKDMRLKPAASSFHSCPFVSFVVQLTAAERALESAPAAPHTARPLNPRHRIRTAAFTLIELLVTIAIIAIVAGLALAALSRSRERTNRSACLSNMRNLHSLASRFAGDNDGALPIGYRLGQKQFNTTLYVAAGNQYVLLGKLLAGASVQDAHVFFCPSERDTTQAYNTKDNPWPVQAGKNLQGGYATNPLVDWGSADFPESPVKLLSLDRVPLLADGVGMPKRVDSRHKDGVNVLFSDGSGRWVPREKFNTDLSGCTSISAGNNAAQDRIWQILGEKDPTQQP